MSDAPQIVKHLFLRLFAHRTGIEENHVRVGWIIRFHHALHRAKQVRHLFRVVLVHLAAKRFYIKFFRHGLYILLSAYC